MPVPAHVMPDAEQETGVARQQFSVCMHQKRIVPKFLAPKQLCGPTADVAAVSCFKASTHRARRVRANELVGQLDQLAAGRARHDGARVRAARRGTRSAPGVALGADNGRRVDWAEREHLGACPELGDTANGGLRARESRGRTMNTTALNVAGYGSAYRAPAAGTRQTLWRGDQGGVGAARKPLARLHAARNVALRR
jgi:hypothetical protein